MASLMFESHEASRTDTININQMDATNHLNYRYPTALTIAGSDSCGGAGIQADLKTFSALGVYGASVITSVTAQNTTGVRAIQAITPEIVKAQIDAVFEDLKIDAVKTGMLHNSDTVRIVAKSVKLYNPKWLVVDPVMISTSGSKLLEDKAIELIVEELFPIASLITPNTDEAKFLSGVSINSVSDMYKAAEKLLDKGCKAVLMKGGHLIGDEMTDILISNDGSEPLKLISESINTVNTHGTGCTLSSAIAAFLAKGCDLQQSVREGKNYISEALKGGSDVYIGAGHGGVNHFTSPIPLIKISRD